MSFLSSQPPWLRTTCSSSPSTEGTSSDWLSLSLPRMQPDSPASGLGHPPPTFCPGSPHLTQVWTSVLPGHTYIYICTSPKIKYLTNGRWDLAEILPPYSTRWTVLRSIFLLPLQKMVPWDSDHLHLPNSGQLIKTPLHWLSLFCLTSLSLTPVPWDFIS